MDTHNNIVHIYLLLIRNAVTLAEALEEKIMWAESSWEEVESFCLKCTCMYRSKDVTRMFQ